MRGLLPILNIDYYKATHAEQYPKGMTKLVSYYTPRKSRLDSKYPLIHFGLQYFVKEMQESFQKDFFDLDKEEVLKTYKRYIENTLLDENDLSKKVGELHDLGYLPLEISSLPEGAFIPMNVPCVQITNTHPDFAWLVNTIESWLSATLWHSQLSASVGLWYRQIVDKYYEATCDDSDNRDKALGDFSFRGQESLESAIISSAGFLTSFLSSATTQTGYFMEKYYNADVITEDVVLGSVSTEHSVMCSNTAVDGDEITMVKRLLNETYPNTSFSMVSDSYDYWNMIDNILPECYEDIMKHNGTLLIRGDSGDPVDIICGEIDYTKVKQVPMGMTLIQGIEKAVMAMVDDKFDGYTISQLFLFDEIFSVEIVFNDDLYHVNCQIVNIESDQDWNLTDVKVKILDKCKNNYINGDSAKKGTVERLWDIFGGTINSKGYKVVNPKVKAIYGDSITVQRCEEIYKRLEAKGFASSNVILGVGSFSMQCIEEDSTLKPFTRDTFSSAVKSTYCEVNGESIPIFKNPKTDTGGFKKSHKGCIAVVRSYDRNVYKYIDGLTFEQSVLQYDNEFNVIYADGKMINEASLEDIRVQTKNTRKLLRLFGGRYE